MTSTMTTEAPAKPEFKQWVDGAWHFDLHWGQSQALISPARYVLLSAGTGGGKTAFGAVWLMDQDAKYPGEKWMAISPTKPLQDRTMLPTLIEIFEGTDFEGVFKQQARQYLLPSGGVVYLCTADKWQSLEGGQFRGVWADEAGQYPYMAWRAIQARLGVKAGNCLLTTTPYAQNWVFHEVYKRWQKGDPLYEVVQFDSIDNPAYPREVYEQARLELTPALFERRYRGMWTALEGVVYPDWPRAYIHRNAMPEGWQKWRKIGGGDFGWHNPFCALSAVISPDDVIYVYEEHYQAEMRLGDHAKRLRPYTVYDFDPSDPQAIEEMQAALAKTDIPGISIRGANNAVALGIEKVSARLRSGRLRVCDCCRNLNREAESYRYKDTEDKLGKEEPIKEDDHAMDALRYMVMGVDARCVEPRIWTID